MKYLCPNLSNEFDLQIKTEQKDSEQFMKIIWLTYTNVRKAVINDS